jgi:hypothetical protein
VADSEDSPIPSPAKRYLAASSAAAIALAVYTWTLAPSVTGEDSGELIAAAYTLGIAHPPGYPLWCMVAHVFTWLPGPSVAWTVNFSSAFFGAAAVFVTTILITHLTRAPFIALCGGLLLAFSHEFWEQSLIAEVYALNIFFIALCTLWLYHWHRTKDGRYLWYFALAYGFSLGNHNTMHLLGPVFGAFILATDPLRTSHISRYIGMAALAFIIAIVIHAYIPLRSLANPPVDWGNPETLQGWWDHVRRAQYGFMFDQYPRGLDRYLAQLWSMGKLMARQWDFLIWILGGGLALWALLVREHRAFNLLLVSIAVVVLAGFAFIQNFNDDREWLWVMTAFLLPANFAVAILISQGAARELRNIPGGGYGKIGYACLVLMAATNLWSVSRHGDDTVPRYIDDLTAEMPEGAIFVPHADHASFPLLYYQNVENKHTDIVLARKYGYLDTTTLSQFVPDLVERYGPAPLRRYEPEILREVHAAIDRPLVFTQGNAGLLRSELHQHGLTWSTVPGGGSPVAQLRTQRPRHLSLLHDYTQRAIAAERYLALAAAEFKAGAQDEALASVMLAVEAYGEDPLFLTNAGVLCARNKAYDTAGEYWERALELRPNLEAARNNLERLNEKTRGATP